MVNPTPVPSNVPKTQQASPSDSLTPSASVSSAGTNNVRIKTEPNSTYEKQTLGQNGGIPNFVNNIAQQRAAQNLAQKFGSTANAQINQLQAQAGIVGTGLQQHNMQNMQLPRQIPERQRKDLDDQKRPQPQSQPQSQHHFQGLQQPQQRPTVNGTQMDGAHEWDAMVAQRHAEASKSRTGTSEADLTFRQQVEKMSCDMEGGGLMLPLSERPKYPQVERQNVIRSKDEAGNKSSQTATQPSEDDFLQLDGANDSDDENIKDDPDLEDDEDAINSDLDDPEEDIVDDGEEEAQKGQIMLCTYDKVQRVKNKWKCTLKDGTLTTGGKE